MKRIIKTDAPDFWKDYIRHNPSIRYNQMNRDNDTEGVRHKLLESLVDEQHGVCAYCCKRINSLERDTCHNEHVVPEKNANCNSMDYFNIVASCSTPKTCGMAKQGQYAEEQFVSPMEDDCSEHFGFSPDGTIMGLDDKGKYMIELLNLNEYGLKQRRRAEYNVCCMYGNDDMVKMYMLQDEQDKYMDFIDMKEYFLKNRLFEYTAPCG